MKTNHCNLVLLICISAWIPVIHSLPSDSAGPTDDMGGYREVMLRAVPKIVELFEKFNTNFPKHLAASKSCDASFSYDISDECKSEIASFASSAPTQPMGFLNVAPMCNACGDTLRPLIDYVQNIRSGYNSTNRDPSCGGARLDVLGDGSLNDKTFTFMQAMLSAACTKHEVEGQRCFEYGGAFINVAAGLVKHRENIIENIFNFTGYVAEIPPSAASIFKLVDSMPFDIPPVCDSLAAYGCCTGTLFNTAMSMLDLSCSSIPTVDTVDDLLKYVCPEMKVPPRCAADDFVLPETTCPTALQHSRVETIINELDSLKSVTDTIYDSCVTNGCPANDCELLFCEPGQETALPHPNDMPIEAVSWDRNRVLG